jgi:hypothetical protein
MKNASKRAGERKYPSLLSRPEGGYPRPILADEVGFYFRAGSTAAWLNEYLGSYSHMWEYMAKVLAKDFPQFFSKSKKGARANLHTFFKFATSYNYDEEMAHQIYIAMHHLSKFLELLLAAERHLSTAIKTDIDRYHCRLEPYMDEMQIAFS